MHDFFVYLKKKKSSLQHSLKQLSSDIPEVKCKIHEVVQEKHSNHVIHITLQLNEFGYLKLKSFQKL
jgi:hypothetical protein